MIFFQFLYREFVESKFLSSLHFSHLAYILNLILSKRFFSFFVVRLAVEIVLFEIQYIRDGRPAIPIFEHKLVAEGH